jgi:hypothetical protein
MTGKSYITWIPEDNGSMNLGRVKDIMDFHSEDNERFAILKNGIDNYICLYFNEDFEFPELKD